MTKEEATQFLLTRAKTAEERDSFNDGERVVVVYDDFGCFVDSYVLYAPISKQGIQDLPQQHTKSSEAD